MKDVYINIRNGKRIRRAKLLDINVVEGDSFGVAYLFDNTERFFSNKTLKQVEEELPLQYFVRINRNVILNILKIKEIHTVKRMAVLENQTEYLVSTRKIKNLIRLLDALN